MLAAGIDGFENTIQPIESCSDDGTKFSFEERKKRDIKQLPENLYEAIERMSIDPFIDNILGNKFMQIFKTKKLQEWEDYISGINSISEWEFQQYLHCG